MRCATRAIVLSLPLLYLLIGCSGRAQPEIVPLHHAHAHNDYAHDRPLLDALDHGFMSIEADIHLVDGELLVAHDLEEVNAARTLRALYLEPLHKRIASNGGSVYPGCRRPLLLMIDIKSDAEPTYRALHDVLGEYVDILTIVCDTQIIHGPILVVVSGNRAVEYITGQPTRYAAIDGRLDDLRDHAPAHLIPLISASARDTFTWRGDGPIPDQDRAKLQDIIRLAHAAGRRVRFWATPDSERVWDVLLNAGVDLINADDLPALRRYLLQRAPEHNACPCASID